MDQRRVHIFHEMGEKLLLPWRSFNIPFFSYLFFVLIGFGGLGIWMNVRNVLRSPEDDGIAVAVSIATYSITLLARSFIDLNQLIEIKNRISLTIFSTVFLGVGVFIFWLTQSCTSDWAFVPAMIGFILAILAWYIANAGSDKFDEDSFNERIRNEAAKIHGQNWTQTP